MEQKQIVDVMELADGESDANFPGLVVEGVAYVVCDKRDFRFLGRGHGEPMPEVPDVVHPPSEAPANSVVFSLTPEWSDRARAAILRGALAVVALGASAHVRDVAADLGTPYIVLAQKYDEPEVPEVRFGHPDYWTSRAEVRSRARRMLTAGQQLQDAILTLHGRRVRVTCTGSRAVVEVVVEVSRGQEDKSHAAASTRMSEATSCDSVLDMRPEVQLFAMALENRLRAKDGEKGAKGWWGMDPNDLFELLKGEVRELEGALAGPFAGARDGGAIAGVRDEALDVAAYCLMVWERAEDA